MKKISWNNSYQIRMVEEDQVFLLSEFDHMFLNGRVYYLLAPLLSKGTYSEDELVDCLSIHTPPEMVYYALSRLEKQNLIFQKCENLSEELRSICGLLNIPENDALKALDSTKVSLTSLNAPVNPEFIALLDSYKIQRVDSAAEADLAVLIVRDYLEKEIEVFHQRRREKPWMLLRATGAQAWVGPFFEPGKTGCYDCLAMRLKHNRQEEGFLLGEETPLLPSHAKLSSTSLAAWHVAATELLKRILLGKSESLEGKILLFDPLRLKLESHLVQQLSSCPHCGNAKSPSDSRPFSLQSRTERDSSGDGYRIQSPEETLQKYAHLVSPITGIVKYLERADHSIGTAAHVYMSGTNWAIPPSLKNRALSSFRNYCGGKGTSETTAKASALCEALERFSGIYQEGDITFRTRWSEIKESAIHPDQILLISQNQYKKRKTDQSSSHHFERISDPFPEDKELAWSSVYSLTEKRTKYLPTAMCYFQYDDPQWNHKANSNGCAAGNCLEEAILQGFFELVERDSVAIWWYNRLQKSAVDLDSFALPSITTLQNAYEKVNRELWALDLTTDLGIPTFVALSRANNSAEEKIFCGFGTHFDAKLALLRALTELNQISSNQSSLKSESGLEDDREKVGKGIIRDWLTHCTVENQPYLRKNEPIRVASDYPKWKSFDLLENISHCQKIVEDLGMEFLVLDQTRPDIGLPVVRVIVPGLCHFWPRFAPGRLYDVPVKMGWLSEPTEEFNLNPIPMFL